MKKITSVITFLLLLFAIYWSFKAAMPTYSEGATIPNSEFSTDRALEHVKTIAQNPHAVGFSAHKEVREYIVSELRKLGLDVSLQEGYTAGDWGNYSKSINILARIKGSETGKALLLLTHYDSSPHSSLGASDAGSGVATILESVRAFLSGYPSPKNDIIILISDAEELGLNGADLFVNKHPWAKEVGLVLNFEARGSGGPSYMLMETNNGNRRLVEEFTKANPEYPVANSLVYSIYKMLPNDTDLTVFRKDGDIEGLNFAFIDDHYDYHTFRDNYDRLDRSTLAHQGSYLMPLLHHFADADLNDLKSPDDFIYFNMPFFGLVSYPFAWVWPMFALAAVIFLWLLVQGFRKKVLYFGAIAKGFLPLVIVLVINGAVGFYSFTILKWLYPQYNDILHGFTYNGYSYIAAFVLFSVGSSFWVYSRFEKISVPNVLVAPILLWTAICALVSIYLPGAHFFVIPLLALLASFMVVINQKEPNPLVLVLLALPALWIFAPFIKMFPVGLGLKMMVASTLLTTLTFFLLLPIFGSYRTKRRLGFLCLLFFLGFMVSAHFNSDFTEDRAKPTSLVYLLDTDTRSAHWGTYDNSLSSWTKKYVDDKEKIPKHLGQNILSSKYTTGFTHMAQAPLKEINPPKIEKTEDTIIGNDRIIEIYVTPQRKVNRLEVLTNEASIKKACINTTPLSDYYLKNRKTRKLITHYISDNEHTYLRLTVSKDSILELTFYEASNDLLSNPLFTVPSRPQNNIPMPFVLNDAIVTIKTITFE